MMPQLRQLIRRIQITTDHLAQDMLVGAYRSAFRGKGMEFEEDREYQQGDDIRTIDWAVTSRMNHPYVKLFREEREMTVMLLVDISSSGLFGKEGSTKREFMTEVAAALAFSAIKNNDHVGLILFTDKVEKYIPPGKTFRHVLRIIRDLLAFETEDKGTDVAAALSFFGTVQSKRNICFLISDFITPDFLKQASLIASKHDLIGIHIQELFDKTLPDISLMQVKDLESGEIKLVNSSSTELQEKYTKNAEEQVAQIKQSMIRSGASWLELPTNKPYINALRKFFRIRGRKRR